MIKRTFLFILSVLFLAQAGFCAPNVIPLGKVESYLQNQWSTLPPEGLERGGKKPWQLILVMNNPEYLKWGAVDDSRKAIEAQIAKGNIKRAAILYVRNDGTTYLTVFPYYEQWRADRLNTSDTPEYNYVKLDTAGLSERDVYSKLFKIFDTDGYYTALVLDMHGDGANVTSAMGYLGSHKIAPVEFISSLAASGLTVDLIDWNSCFMGSIGNMYDLFSSTKTRYALVHSNEGVDQQTKHITNNVNGKSEKVHGSTGAHPIIEALEGTPKQAATKLFEKAGVSTTASFVHNAFVVDGDYFRSNTMALVKDWTADLKASGLPLNFKSDANGFPATWFTDYLRQLSNDYNTPYGLRDKSLKLLGQVNNSILMYNCWDSSTSTLYNKISSVPSSSSCIGGFSIETLPGRAKALW